MNKINFFSAGTAGGGDTGIPSGTGDNFLLLDGTRAVAGSIPSDVSGGYSIGTWDKAFSSGVFQNVVLSGFKMSQDNGDLLIDHTDGRTTIARARMWWTATSGAAITGARFQNIANGQIAWRPAGTDINGAYDTNICRSISGCICIGTTTANASGTLEATSGVFRTQIVFAAPNGSGWKVTVDNNGILQTTGPIVLE